MPFLAIGFIDLAAMIIGQHCGKMRAAKGLEYILANKAVPARKGGEDVESGEADVYENDMVRKALEFMRANMDSKHSLEDVSHHVGTHPRQLHRAFMANANMAPMAYWRKMRLERGRRLLANTSLSITSIAMDCGFADSSHFILWFRRQFGETPFAYRKRRHMVER